MFGRCGCTLYVLSVPMMDVEPIPRLKIGIKRIPDLNISNYIEPRFVSHVALVRRRSRMARVSEQVETFNDQLERAAVKYSVKLT